MRSRKKVSRKDIIEEMEKDLFRLQRISTRFSQIGSKPDLKEADVASILKETAEYIQRRAPQLGRKVVIKESYAYVPLVGVNKDLFQWAAENVLKNGLDAMDKKAGEIHIWMGIRGDGKRIIIDIQDNGRGMEKSQQRRIFRPGYSTKKRGWGLGLTLAKRIIEEYHGGRLFVKESKPGIGTVIRIELKI
jgi:signal transduction histidine kinase